MSTDFSQIQFNKEYHTYTLNGVKLTSVSRVISKLKPQFDAAKVAAKKALERGVTADVILAEWDEARKQAMAKGSRVHEYIQSSLTGHLGDDDPFVNLNRSSEMNGFRNFWVDVNGDLNPDIIHQVEWVVGDDDLKVAGTIDAVLFHKTDYLYHLWDWKTGDKFRLENRFQNLLPPFGHLSDCELVNYSLQISLYRLIVERNTDLYMGDSYILHLAGDGSYQVHKALDLRSRLEGWLKEVSRVTKTAS